MDAGYTVTHLEDSADSSLVELLVVFLDLPPKNSGNFAGAQRHARPLPSVQIYVLSGLGLDANLGQACPS